MRCITLSFIALWVTACSNGHDPAAAHQAPSHAETIASETELLRLTLSPSSQARLGIGTAFAASNESMSFRELSGEVVISPLVASGVPTDSSVNLQLLAAQQVQADADIENAAAQVTLAEIALERAKALLLEEAGSQRAIDEAVAAAAAAEISLRAAKRQRYLLGPAVEDMNLTTSPWIRVPVFSSDLNALRRDASAQVRSLSGQGTVFTALPVKAPPSANARVGTVDLYYALGESLNSSPDAPRSDKHSAAPHFQVGERVAVALPVMQSQSNLSVPREAILRDMYGGEWVYLKVAEYVYLRQRVDVVSEHDGLAFLSRGLTSGDEVVTAGAAELFGIEFGAGH